MQFKNSVVTKANGQVLSNNKFEQKINLLILTTSSLRYLNSFPKSVPDAKILTALHGSRTSDFWKNSRDGGGRILGGGGNKETWAAGPWTNKEGLVGVVEPGGSLGCSDLICKKNAVSIFRSSFPRALTLLLLLWPKGLAICRCYQLERQTVDQQGFSLTQPCLGKMHRAPLPSAWKICQLRMRWHSALTLSARALPKGLVFAPAPPPCSSLLMP